MKNSWEIVFNEEKNIFKYQVESYYVDLLLAKDEILASVLRVMVTYLNNAFEQLETKGNPVLYHLENQYKETIPEIMVETLNTEKCVYEDEEIELYDSRIELFDCRVIDIAVLNSKIEIPSMQEGIQFEENALIEESMENDAVTWELQTQDDEVKNATFRVIFDSIVSHLIVESYDNMLIYDCFSNRIIENTFSDDEVDAILHLLSFVIGGAVHEPSKRIDKQSCKIIDIATCRRIKSVK